MGSFLVWDLTSGDDGVWRSIDAENEREAAEAICGMKLRTIGNDFELCARVRSLDNEDQRTVIFYGTRITQPVLQAAE